MKRKKLIILLSLAVIVVASSLTLTAYLSADAKTEPKTDELKTKVEKQLPTEEKDKKIEGKTENKKTEENKANENETENNEAQNITSSSVNKEKDNNTSKGKNSSENNTKENSSSAQANTQTKPQQSVPTPISTPAPTPAPDPNAGKVWHEALTEQKYVETRAAWEEEVPIYNYHDICYCGYDLTSGGTSFMTHQINSGCEAAGYRGDIPTQVGTNKVVHEAEGYYETVVIREAGYY